MGCGGSKSKTRKGSGGDVVDVEDIEISYKGSSEIKKRVHTIMALKSRHQRAIWEKCGIEYYIEEGRTKLTELSETLLKSKESYNTLLGYAMEKDVDELYVALSSNSRADKKVLIEVLTTRTRWQMAIISETYEQKYGDPLIQKIKDNLRTSMGFFTGNNTDLGRLLLMVVTDQPERDAQLLLAHVNDFDIILEVCCKYAQLLYGYFPN
jgi:hypothetical protein